MRIQRVVYEGFGVSAACAKQRPRIGCLELHPIVHKNNYCCPQLVMRAVMGALGVVLSNK